MLSKLFKSNTEPLVRLVTAVNGVDKVGPGNWDEQVNAPSREQEVSISQRCEDIAKKLSRATGLPADQIEYYSALKRYRLMNLLATVIGATTAGFKLDSVEPRDPFELATPEVRAYAEKERKRRATERTRQSTPMEQLRFEMKKAVPEEQLAKLEAAFRREQARPPKLALFGKAGVGKTTTINNLLNAKWKTSHTIPGTLKAQVKEFDLENGGLIAVVDLPGYGRSVREDSEYEEIYKEVLPDCDVVVLVLQANTRDMSDDQEMIGKLIEWLKASPRKS